MALGWNEVKERAVRFSKEWQDAFNEEADAKQFLIEFFNVFGISNRRVATFEHRVKKLGDFDGYIDLLWKGTMLIEMKSRGKNLDKAYQQAIDYTHGLKEVELPKYILVSDFATFRLYDLDENQRYEFALPDLVSHVQLFGFIAGYQKRTYKEEDPVNIEAAYHMGILHDALKEAGYTGRDLEIYLVRLLFCLFADDTGIFERSIFIDYLEQKTNTDGADLGMHLAQLFQVLNTPNEKRQKTLDESLAQFPYINGHLFEQQLPFASFNSRMRATLLQCSSLDWNKISPAIFGSMFQSVMNETERRNLGAHYTSEKNILKLIKPLLLDALWQEFAMAKTSTGKLRAFHKKVASLRFLDPACGCGNFLVITYRELRLLELEILKVLQKGQRVLDLDSLLQCNVDRFYGIEYEEFPAQIAQVALWLTDHQMNMQVSAEFGEYFVRLPLKKSAKIVQGNALRIDWDSLLVSEKTISIHAKEANIIQVHEQDVKYGKVNVFAERIIITDKAPIDEPSDLKFDYILGNPPFVGKSLQNPSQKSDMEIILGDVKGAGVLDYVSAWYIKAAQYLKKYNTEITENDRKTCVAFVSTNSIAQGEQVGIIWNELFSCYHIKIHFAHRTFKWGNEARANAAVHVVIIGFSNFNIPEKRIFEYENINGEPHELKVKNINPYLVEGNDLIILSRDIPISDSPIMLKGSQPTDGGNLLFSDLEVKDFIKLEPQSEKFIRPFISAHEFINGENRWCLWLKDIEPDKLRTLPNVLKRIEAVRQMRLKSTKAATVKWAQFPTQFTEDRQPYSDYILVPSHSSENRKIIPTAYLSKENILNNSCFSIPKARRFHFGVINSEMHMTWVKYVCGRIKSDYRYSNTIVYNNFPWPETPSEKQKEAIEAAAQKVLDVRAGFPGASLADLYNPLTMPPALVKAHNDLDKVVDLAYRPQPFINETKRIEFLFELYDKYTTGLFAVDKKKKKS
jgi:hypothetical protein